MIVDLYAGPGGWSHGLRQLGLTDVGIELDTAACATRAAAGHATIRADVAAIPIEPMVGRVTGLIASPPCQSFSTAGLGEGRDQLDALCAAVHDGAWWAFDRASGYGHVLEIGRWAETLRPIWVACEQVPPVLPVWHAYAARWRALGWSTWAGILNSADFGVPQTRRRAFLIARTDGRPVGPPTPTHCQDGALTIFDELSPWVTMAEALGWDDRSIVNTRGKRTTPGGNEFPVDRPSWALTEKARSWQLDRRQQTNGVPVRLIDCDTEPAPTLTGSGKWAFQRPTTSDNAIRLTIADVLTLQGFPPDYPVQGTRTAQFRQVGDAVPPPLAAAVADAVCSPSPDPTETP